ncbi:MAG: hypothetical protein JRJ39_01585 [Deltaproteobacteria bacterium]|nr:hypothetical protein [Deltaproteobacteria bacterium]MBW1848659.1 hypothetical protein [Deltaproteobacteria bacterium]
MRKMIFIIISIFLVVALFVIPSFADERTDEGGTPQKDFPLGFPFESWGGVKYTWDDPEYQYDAEEGFHYEAYFEQGVDWFEVYKIKFNTFAGFILDMSDTQEYYCDDNVELVLGTKAKYFFELSPISWGTIALGVRAEMYWFTSSKSPMDDGEKYVLFEQWSFDGDLRNLEMLKSTGTNPFPLGYPFLSWGELSYTWNDIETGWLIECYIEQGIDWFKFYDFTFNTFSGLVIAQSDDKPEYWNNKVSPRLGIKIKRPISFFEGPWAELTLGVHGEYDAYTSSQSPKDVFRLEAYVQWAFSGDWKTIK